MDEYLADNAATETEDVPFSESFAEDGAAAVENETVETQEVPQEETQDAPQEGGEEDITKTQAFSRRLREMSAQQAQQEVDRFIGSMGFVNPYTKQPIRSKAEYERYARMYEAQKRGQDPVITAQLADMQDRLSGYELRDQDIQLLNDPQRGEIYRQLRPEVQQLLQYCQRNGLKKVDVKTAFNTILSNRLPDILKNAGQKSQQETVKKLSANAAASPGSLGKGTDTGKVDFAKMSDQEFENWVKKAERGELMKS